MQKCKVINKSLPYAGQLYPVGSVFDCDKKFVRVLQLLKRVETVQNEELEPEQPAPRRRGRPRKNTEYQTRELTTKAG